MMDERGTVGIMPAGALGVALFYHLTDELQALDGTVRFLQRQEDDPGAVWREATGITVRDRRGREQFVERERVFAGSLRDAWQQGKLPEVVLVCVNPDQLFDVVSSLVHLLEAFHEKDRLSAERLPITVLSSNGIFYQRIRQVLIEKLEEATLLGCLPDLWPDLMPRIVSRLVRGVTIQTGLREGSGAGAVYVPGPPGPTILAGGGTADRQRALKVLKERGARVSQTDRSPTRAEFDKALVNLSSNLMGILIGVDEQGTFRALRVGEIYRPEHHAAVRELTEHVLAVGKAVRVFPPKEKTEVAFQELLDRTTPHAEHVPSSLQWLEQQIRQKRAPGTISPTEEWLINPLIHYTRSAGLPESAEYFEGLKAQLASALARVAQRYSLPAAS